MENYKETEEALETLWLQEDDDHKELKKICYKHMSDETMSSCAKIMQMSLKTDIKPREFTQVFLHHFVERYHGQDILHLLQSLVKRLRKYPEYSSLSELTHELEWLTCKINLKRKAFSLCGEDEMSTFPEYVSKKLPSETCRLKLNQCPDIRSKLTRLMTMTIQSPRYYNIFKTFCQEKVALTEYVSMDLEIRAKITIYVSISVSSIYINLHLPDHYVG